jgi:hypothetical protein
MATQEYDRMLETLREVNTLCAKAQGHYHAAMGFEANANHADQKASLVLCGMVMDCLKSMINMLELKK